MRFDNRQLVLAVLGASIAALGACAQTGAGSTDSAVTPARTDTATPPASASATPTVRSDSVVLRTDKAQYKAGEKMTLTLENRSAATYAFNPCTRSIEREEAGTARALTDEGRMCTMEAWILAPRGTRSGPTELPATMTPGRYRVVVRLTVEGSAAAAAIMAVSDPIRVS